MSNTFVTVFVQYKYSCSLLVHSALTNVNKILMKY